MKYKIVIIAVIAFTAAFGIGQHKENQQLKADLQSRQQKIEETKDAAQKIENKLETTETKKKELKKKLQKKRELEKTLRTEVDTLERKLSAKRERQRRIALAQKVQAREQQQTTSVAPSGNGTCEPYRDIINNYDWDVATAMRICKAESEGNPRAANWTDDHRRWAGCMGSFGLFQINCSHGKLYNPHENIKVAHQMYSSGGWGQWTTY